MDVSPDSQPEIKKRQRTKSDADLADCNKKGRTLDTVTKQTAYVSRVYKKVDEITHVLGRPGMYIGSTTRSQCELEILYDDETLRDIESHNATWTEGEERIEVSVVKNVDSLIVERGEEDAHDEEKACEAGAVHQQTEPARACESADKEQPSSRAGAQTLNRQNIGSGILRARVSAGLVRLLIEALQNAVDASFEDSKVNRIEVDIDSVGGCIQVMNTGTGIPVQAQAEGGEGDMLVPELVFGHLRAGSNFADMSGAADAQRVGSGLNGVGITLANIFSTRFEASTGDITSGKEWRCTWTDNSKSMSKHSITKYTRKNGYVCVKFFPDMARFDSVHCKLPVPCSASRVFDAATSAVFKSCVYDLVAVVPDRVSIYLNGRKLALRGLVDYARVMGGTKEDGGKAKMVIIDSVPCPSNSGYIKAIVCPASATTPSRPVAFVNGIRCSAGAHVDHVLDAIKNVLVEMLSTSRGGMKELSITRARVRQLFWVCILSKIPNPHFKSQTKEELDMTVPQLKCSVNPLPSNTTSSLRLLGKPLLKSLAERTKAVADVVALQKSASLSTTKTSSPGSSIFGSGNVVHHPKLTDAPNAGPLSSKARKIAPGARHLRRLYVAEGDSAGELVKCGLRASADPENCGVLVARGKILNVRNTDLKRIAKNEFVVLMSRALGLVPGKEYTTLDDLKSLRYDYLVAFADQDSDGHHIVGLLVNAIDYLFPGLFKIRPDFVKRFATPVVRCASTRSDVCDATFLTLHDFNQWYTPERQKLYPPSKIRYLKGLGGSNGPEAREYFTHEQKLSITLRHTGVGSITALSVLFSDDLANERKRILAGLPATESSVAHSIQPRGVLTTKKEKECLLEDSERPAVHATLTDFVYKPDAVFDYTRGDSAFEEYAQKAVTHFSWEDVERSMPDLSGFKEVHRKIVHGFVVKNIRSVRKLGVAVAECTAASHYNHGEQSITEATIGLAQMHTGTNNVPVMVGVGQFGTRNNPPDKHAAPRYLSIYMSPLMDTLMPRADVPVLRYKSEEGRVIEPVQFSPIVPWVLVNGAAGIATGWSTVIPSFNPIDIVNTTRKLVQISLQTRREATLPIVTSQNEGLHPVARVDMTAICAVKEGGTSALTADTAAASETCRPASLSHVYAREDYNIWQHEADKLLPWVDMFNGHKSMVYDAEDLCKPKFVIWKSRYLVGEPGSEEVGGDPGLRLIVIDELPPASWTSTWKTKLYERNFIHQPASLGESVSESKTDTADARRYRFVKDARIKETDINIKVELLCDNALISPLLVVRDGDTYPMLEQALLLTTRQSMQNMHVFDHYMSLRKMTYIHEFFTSHYDLRYRTYVNRVEFIREMCMAQLRLISNKYRFILMLVRGEYTLVRKTVASIDEELEALGFDSDQLLKSLEPTSNAPDGKTHLRPDQQEQTYSDAHAEEGASESTGAIASSCTYAYLRRMPVDSMSAEVLSKLEKEKKDAEARFQKATSMAIEDVWLEDLDAFETALLKAQDAKRKEYSDNSTSTLSSTAAPRVGKSRRK